jgi:dihydrofolate synthase / folylpolyglutamate synthase
MEWLGNDLESIGKEKAGIFREKKPAVLGDFHLLNSIRDIALSLNAPLYRQGIDFGYEIQGDAWYFWHQKIKTPLLPMPSLLLQNVATALMALTLLNSRLPIPNPALLKGISSAFLPGRFQKIANDPLTILDVAHNPASCQQLAIRLQQTPIQGKTHAIVGMLVDKDSIKSLAPLLPIIDVWHVTSLQGERGAPASRLTSILKNLGARYIHIFESVIDAYTDALNQTTINDRIVAFGSFHTISPILNYHCFKE